MNLSVSLFEACFHSRLTNSVLIILFGSYHLHSELEKVFSKSF